MRLEKVKGEGPCQEGLHEIGEGKGERAKT